MRSARAWPCALSANDSSTQLLLDSVQLYKALGGGWQVFEPTRCARGGQRRALTRIHNPIHPIRGTVVKTSLTAAVLAGPIAVL